MNTKIIQKTQELISKGWKQIGEIDKLPIMKHSKGRGNFIR